MLLDFALRSDRQLSCADCEIAFLRLQEESEQRPHKISYHVSVAGANAAKLVQNVEEKLTYAGLTAKLIYSGGADLDVLPQGASKGKGLEFLLSEVGLEDQSTVVAQARHCC